jgi:hypothetical protein
MAETASTEPLTVTEENPSLDPAAIERAYRRERARRRAKIEHRQYARNSNARYWVAVAVIALITIVLGLMALREIQTSFGIFQ